MFKTDTGNFNRFLTSIGLLLLAAAVVVPYFFFQDTETLRISHQELQGLTATARDALEVRQRRIAHLEVPVLVLSVILALGGTASLGFGGKRLRTAQEKEDEAIERRARRENYEIQRLTRNEVEERRDEQAREAVQEEGVESEDRSKERATTLKPLEPSAPERASRGEIAQRPAPAFSNWRQEIARLEEDVKSSLEELESERFKYLADVKIVGPRSSRPGVSVDGLFEGQTSNQPDVAMELKVPRVPVPELRGRGRLYADVLLADLARYRALTGREALGWLLIIIPESLEGEGVDQREQIEKRFNDLLAGIGKCSIVMESEVGELPRRFTQIFGK